MSTIEEMFDDVLQMPIPKEEPIKPVSTVTKEKPKTRNIVVLADLVNAALYHNTVNGVYIINLHECSIVLEIDPLHDDVVWMDIKTPYKKSVLRIVRGGHLSCIRNSHLFHTNKDADILKKCVPLECFDCNVRYELWKFAKQVVNYDLKQIGAWKIQSLKGELKMSLKDIEELKGFYITDIPDDNMAFARDLQRRLTDIDIKVDFSIPGIINLSEYNKPMIQIIGFDKGDCDIFAHIGLIHIKAFDALFELKQIEEDKWRLNSVYRKM